MWPPAILTLGGCLLPPRGYPLQPPPATTWPKFARARWLYCHPLAHACTAIRHARAGCKGSIRRSKGVRRGLASPSTDARTCARARFQLVWCQIRRFRRFVSRNRSYSAELHRTLPNSECKLHLDRAVVTCGSSCEGRLVIATFFLRPCAHAALHNEPPFFCLRRCLSFASRFADTIFLGESLTLCCC